MLLKSIKYTRFYYIIKIIILKFFRLFDPNFVINKGKGGTNSSRYCYSVFMRHLVCLYNNGILTVPDKIAEFGPGDSLGTGICAILSGANEYYAFDIIKRVNNSRILDIFDELVIYFKNKYSIPDNIEFPRIGPMLDDYSFPDYILDDLSMEKNLSEERIETIRNLLVNLISDNENSEMNGIIIKYIVPWEKYKNKYPIVDFIFSQAVLEHIDNLDLFYSVMNKILLDNCFTSHYIDFTSHDEAYEWNGHWAINQKYWNRAIGKRSYSLNREPLSTHIKLLEKYGFQIKASIPWNGLSRTPSIKRNKLDSNFKHLTDEDFKTSSCFIIANNFSNSNLDKL